MKNDAKQDSCEQITFSDIFSSMNIMTDDTCIDLPLDWGEAFDPASGSQDCQAGEPEAIDDMRTSESAVAGVNATKPGPSISSGVNATQPAPTAKTGHAAPFTQPDHTIQPAPAVGRRRSAAAGSARTRRAGSISDALIFSLADLGRVDIEYMADISGETPDSVISALRGSIFQDPLKWDGDPYEGWETAEEYLSGNLMRKLKEAREAGRQHGDRFAGNIRAIEKVLTPAASADDIYITLGSPWVPADVIDDFMLHLFGDPLRHWHSIYKERIMESWRTRHDELTGTWEIPEKSRYDHSVAVRRTYGTEKMEALHILEKTLNMKTVKVTTEIKAEGNSSGKKRVVDKEETAAALEKQRRLIGEFRRWVWADPARKERLEKIFEDRYGCVRQRHFDGSFLEFPGLSPEVDLYPYQKDAVARIIFSPNTLLAHDVGAGKTYVMIAAGQELRRMGLSKKNMYVVPNNIVQQWRSIFLRMYPEARLLCVEPGSFVPKKRQEILRQIRDRKFDGIIIAYSCFEQIPLSKKYRIKELRREKKEITALVRQKSKATARLKKKKEAIEKELAELLAAGDPAADEAIYFEQLGITRLFVDEAHNFKNIPIDTKIDSVLGISTRGSKKCREMMDKVHMIQQKNGGKGVVLATGTPITNSVTDAFVMQQYLQSGELRLLDLGNFDSWIGMFAEKVTEFEVDVDTNGYRLATRFARFHNLPELTALLSSVADFHRVDDRAGLPAFSGYDDVLLPKTPEFSEYLNKISVRADDVRKGRVSRRDDNMLKITTDGRKAALDLRLVEAKARFVFESKVARCAENIAKIYYKTAPYRSTQIVFCDISTPKAGFNLYDELKTLLVGCGLKPGEIAFVHDAATASARSALFARVREGEIRVLIGSTFKLGLGVNIQDRLIALHHLDVPWRPADMTQREGRILRQGNTSERAYIFRYITEGSFDAYSWQLLETKQKFISALLSGSLTERSGSDIDDTVLDYAEVKALAIGNPLVKKRVEAANELSRLMTLQRKAIDSKIGLEKELLSVSGRIEDIADRIEKCKKDRAACEERNTGMPPLRGSRAQYGESREGALSDGLSDDGHERRAIREQISRAVRENILEREEKKLMTYRGFDLILPAHMMGDNPYIIIAGEGRYRVEMGDTEVGNLRRVDNFISNLGGHLEKLEISLEKLKERKKDIEAELEKKESYSEQISSCKETIEKMDKKLKAGKK